MNVNLLAIVLLAAATLLIIGTSRGIPFGGIRRAGLLLLRLGAWMAVWMALQPLWLPTRIEQPRHVVYLVDQSASISAEQTDWMARRIASVDARRPPSVSRTVLAFADRTCRIMPTHTDALTDPAALAQALRAAELGRQTTNLEQALLSTVGRGPSEGSHRVILISDGRPTGGDVERIMEHVSGLGLEVYSVSAPPAPQVALAWDRLAAPATARQGSTIPLRLLITNTTDRLQPVAVTASLEDRRAVASTTMPPAAPGVRLNATQAWIPPGTHVVSLPVPALHVGTMALAVTLAQPDRGVLERRRAMVEIEGPLRLLFVMDRLTELPVLAAALQRHEMELALATPSEVPSEVGAMAAYDAVVLFGVPKSSLSEAQAEALTHYVRQFGGGVFMVGLGGRLDAELRHEAPLDALLPVRFEPKGLQEAKRRVCVLMLIDRSQSMYGDRIAATKRAAVELINQLAPEDLVGVLAFDAQPYVVVEMQPALQAHPLLVEKLVRLKSIGGTDLLPALQAAHQRLAQSGATVKHILLLSDGMTPFDAEAYRHLLEAFARENVSVSTIGIGAMSVNVPLLTLLANATGGTFYRMTSLEELPQLVATDTQRALGRLPFAEGSFRPVSSASSTWFADHDAGSIDWPPLNGYLTTTAKPGAVVEVAIQHSDTADPLLAHWIVGAGQVGVFASDADRRWSPEWIRWSSVERVWATVLRHLTRHSLSEDIFVWLADGDGQTHVVIEGPLEQPAVFAIDVDGAMQPLALMPQSRFRWRAPVDHLAEGWHQLLITSALPSPESPPADGEASGAGRSTTRWVHLGGAATIGEQPPRPPDDELLRRLAAATGGIAEAPDAAFLPPTVWLQRRLPLRQWLLPLALLLWLCDVALRGRTLL